MLTAKAIIEADVVRGRWDFYKRENGEAITARSVSSRMQAATVVRSGPLKPALLLKWLYHALLSRVLCKKGPALQLVDGFKARPGDLLFPPTPARRAPDPALLPYCFVHRCCFRYRCRQCCCRDQGRLLFELWGCLIYRAGLGAIKSITRLAM